MLARVQRASVLGVCSILAIRTVKLPGIALVRSIGECELSEAHAAALLVDYGP